MAAFGSNTAIRKTETSAVGSAASELKISSKVMKAKKKTGSSAAKAEEENVRKPLQKGSF